MSWTSQISRELYQYAAIDDCIRYRVLRLYERRTAVNTLELLDLAYETRFSDEAYVGYNAVCERIQDPIYKAELELRRLKRSL
jgi:hypothetical protein